MSTPAALPRRKSLATQVWEALSERIRSGALEPGAQLPTEAELCAEFGVSRTVVREAVARLRSGGMVVPQQGRGVFVSEDPLGPGFQITDDELRTLPETISLLELRMSVEVEAAGLCARRASRDEIAAIRSLMDEVDSRHEDPATTQIHYDYDFHLRIAQGSGNALMLAFLEYLRPLIVPRYQLRHVVAPSAESGYYDRIHTEHARIVSAIEAGDSKAARMAMRAHLASSLDRVRALAEAAGTPTVEGVSADTARTLFPSLLRDEKS